LAAKPKRKGNITDGQGAEKKIERERERSIAA
jgi:hypothetical protein